MDDKGQKTTRVFCPHCYSDLTDAGHLVLDGEWVRYRCTACGECSTWDFAPPVPMLVWPRKAHGALTSAVQALVDAARRVVREANPQPQPDGPPLRLPPSPESVDALAEALRPFGGERG
jgi:hypothetical protein